MMVAILMILAGAAGVSQLSMRALLRFMAAGLGAVVRPAQRKRVL